jgi:FMN phosphatase YigB (HAD superfamily)
MALRGVIFDMGGTLLDYHPPHADPKQGWQEMENTGADALRLYLQEQGYPVPDADAARAANFAIMERHWRQIGKSQGNPQLSAMLREVMADWGIPDEALNDGLLDSAMAAYVAPVQAFVAPLDGAADTLAALRAAGLRIGLISNTVWPGAFHLDDLSRFGLRDYLECAFFSADVAAWKPGAAVFELALAALELDPAEAVYVGDHPYFDVYGAQQAGLRGVWMRSDEWEDPAEFGLSITPDATLERLPDLVDTIQRWR